ncbi:CoA ester lyase [Rhodococcus rhodnii]|uniref:CoA ester lyase n=1 Tax=Rhodococcus rhodnii TaxID=38312 RepID=A0A6P2CKX7_9NOCA|nr:CoA ester lyase [Rhodococcus rhodnii]TXG92481.1 CoA ester lyase [Rhodococcus rhodnii]
MAPASDERKARKALASNADEVILDLEDAVVDGSKDSAREAALALVAEFGEQRAVSIRINGADTVWHRDDVAACARADHLASIVLPKAETPEQIRSIDAALGNSSARIQALVETPRGIRDVSAIAESSDRLAALVIGYADLAAALGRSPGLPHTTWQTVQEAVLLAARVAEIQAIDGPHLTIADDEVFAAAKTWVRDLGFDGTWVIHPAQIDTALRVFTPTPEAVADAHRVLAALAEAADRGSGAAELDGRMLDEALAVSARRVLANAPEATA